jgi:hypothetical protein
VKQLYLAIVRNWANQQQSENDQADDVGAAKRGK